MKQNKKIVVLGAGESGVGTALLAQAKGYDVFVSDKGTIKENYKQYVDVKFTDYSSFGPK